MLDKFMLAEAFNLAEDVEEFTIDPVGLNDLDSFLATAGTDPEDDFIDVIDPEAQAEEDLQQSYLGKVIANCNVCHSDIFMDRDTIEIDEDGLVDIVEACPYCGSVGDGYVIVGEVKPFDPNADFEEDDIDIEEPIDDIDIDNMGEDDIDLDSPFSDEEEPIEEGLKADKVKALKRNDRINGRKGLQRGKGLEASDEIRGPKYKELDEAFSNDYIATVDGEDFFVSANSLEDAKRKFNQDLGGKVRRKPDSKVTWREADKTFRKGNRATKNLSNDYSTDYVYTPEDKEYVRSKITNESIQDISVGTEDETMTMTTKDDGGVVIETTPKDAMFSSEIGGEMLAPLDDMAKDDIIDTATAEDEAPMDDFGGDEFAGDDFGEDEFSEDELDFDDFDEDSFDGLGESYLRRCYDNVSSFKTTSVGLNEGILTVEGKIGFTSGNEKDTKFIFEGFTKGSKQKLTGFNENISRGKKSFKLGCTAKNGKLVCESLNYNYKSKNENNDSIRVYGTVRRGK